MRAHTWSTRRPFVVASVAIAIAASGLALWLAGGRGGRPPLLLSASALGVAISGMHYTAMAGLTLFSRRAAAHRARPRCRAICSPSWSPSSPSCVSGIFLLTLVPDRSSAGQGDAPATARSDRRCNGSPTRRCRRRRGGNSATAGKRRRIAELGRGTYAPLGGAGGPPRRFARHLPVERDGITHFVAVDDVVAVHANAHYTYIFDGTAKLFCPLPIGDVESRLDTSRFMRVHRSHIVNIERVVEA